MWGETVARSVGLFLRQARLAQPIKEVLDIFGAFELRQLPLRAIDRVLRIDPHDFGGLCVGLIELPELRQIGGQEDVTLPPVWDPQRKFAERSQRLRIL